MKKIALVELQEHQEVLFGLLELLLLQEVDIYVFAPHSMHQEWNSMHTEQFLHWYTFEPGERVPAFIRQHKEILDGLDLVFFTTLIRDFASFAALHFRPPTLLLVHKGNAFFAAAQHLQLQGWADGLRYLLRLWRREDHYRRQFMAKLDAFCFADESIREYMQGSIDARYRVLPAVPLVSFTEWPLPQNDEIRIVIPGTVSAHTRDYELLFQALQKVDLELKRPVQLIFLGQAHGAKARQLFRLMASQTFQSIDIQVYTESVSTPVYEQVLRQADFLVLPLRQQIRFGLIREYYGQTSISGGINDLLRYGKPALLPVFYPLHPVLHQLTQRYHHAEELADLLLHWVNEQSYQNLAAQALPQLQLFSKARQSQRLWQILEALL